jgi:hypothetical protein
MIVVAMYVVVVVYFVLGERIMDGHPHGCSVGQDILAVSDRKLEGITSLCFKANVQPPPSIFASLSQCCSKFSAIVVA